MPKKSIAHYFSTGVVDFSRIVRSRGLKVKRLENHYFSHNQYHCTKVYTNTYAGGLKRQKNAENVSSLVVKKIDFRDLKSAFILAWFDSRANSCQHSYWLTHKPITTRSQ